MPQKKRMFISIGGSLELDVLNMVFEAMACRHWEIVNNPDDADVIVAISAGEASRMLRKSDEAIVLFAIFPVGGGESQPIKTAARALKRAYQERIIVGHLDDAGTEPGDVRICSYLMGRQQTNKEDQRG